MILSHTLLAVAFEAGYYCSYHGKLETNYIIFGKMFEILSPQKISKKKNWGWKIENRKEYSGIFCFVKWNRQKIILKN